MKSQNILSISILFNSFFNFVENTNKFNLKNNNCKYLSDYRNWFWNPNCEYNRDLDSTFPQICHNHGYYVETHTVVTSDGYILNLFRLPKSKFALKKRKYPIFLQHGLLSDSDRFVLYGNRSLDFYLADQGFDVWFGNLRGTKYSKKHLEFNLEQSQYWNFNLDTLANYDVATMVEYVVKNTGSKIIYIGYSMGNTLVYMYASKFSNVARKNLEAIVSLAPVAFMKNVSILRRITKLINWFKFAEFKNVFLHEEEIYKITSSLCRVFPISCFRVLYGNSSDQFLPSDFLATTRFGPASLDVILHYIQIGQSNELKMFDLGGKNLLIYGSQTPPPYKLKNISVPVYLFYGEADALATKENVYALFDSLSDVIDKSISKIPENNDQILFRHSDFISARNIVSLFYPSLIERLNAVDGK